MVPDERQMAKSLTLSVSCARRCIARFQVAACAVMLAIAAFGCATVSGPLATLPIVSPQAAESNLRGIRAYDRQEWGEAQRLFEEAIRADDGLPEAHFNLALTLHQRERHNEAKAHFRRAGELAPKNASIVESPLYRDHLGLSSIFERHFNGGYRYGK